SEAVYSTTLPVSRVPERIVEYYNSRWGIENRCNRILSQTWKMRVLVARKYNAIFAQIVMVSMCYKACRIYLQQFLSMFHP
ncbi:MAG: transposase, partial [Firmicutes bacterium]|nr:transposase [Bacillota bacterium]